MPLHAQNDANTPSVDMKLPFQEKDLEHLLELRVLFTSALEWKMRAKYVEWISLLGCVRERNPALFLYTVCESFARMPQDQVNTPVFIMLKNMIKDGVEGEALNNTNVMLAAKNVLALALKDTRTDENAVFKEQLFQAFNCVSRMIAPSPTSLNPVFPSTPEPRTRRGVDPNTSSPG